MADEEIEKLKIGIEADASGYEDGLTQAEDATTSWADRLSGKFAGLGTVLTGLGTAGVAAFGAIGLASLDIASQVHESQNTIQDQLGLTQDQAKELTDVATNIFGGNWGESMEDVTASLIEVRQQMKGLSDEELQDATEGAIKLRDIFGFEITESTNAANALMKNFGLTTEEAYDFIAAGQQKGLNTSGDFLETIGEYSNQFGEAGFSAEEFFSTLQTGAGSGVLGTDKIADSFKEFRILTMEMSDDVLNAYGSIGSALEDNIRTMTGLGKDQPFLINTAENARLAAAELDKIGIKLTPEEIARLHEPIQVMDEKTGETVTKFQTLDELVSGNIYKGIKDGTLSAADAQKIAIKGLQQMDSELYQNTAGVALFGTAWEDAGASTILGVDLAATSMDDLSGTTDALGAKYNTFGAMFEGVWRQIQTEALLPIGQTLLGLANEVMPYISEAIAGLGAFLKGDGAGLAAFATNISGLFDNLDDIIMTQLENLFGGMLEFVAANVGPWLEGFGELAQVAISWIVEATPKALEALSGLFQSLVGFVVENVPQWAITLLDMATALTMWVLDALPDLIKNLGEVWTGLFNWVLESLPKWGTELGKLGAHLIAWVQESLPGLGEKLGTVLKTMVEWVASTIVEIAPKLAGLAWEFVGWVVTDVLPELPGVLWDIGAALVGFISNLIVELAPSLLDLAGSFLGWVGDSVLPFLGEKLGAIWDAISTWIGDMIGNVGEAAAGIGQAMLDGIANTVSAGADLITGVVKALINPIIDFLNTVIDGANEIATTLGFDPIDRIPKLRTGTSHWQGGVAIAGEAGNELAFFSGEAAVLTGGVYDLPAGTEVWNASRTSAAMNQSGGGMTINQNFGNSIDTANVRALAYEGAQQALREASMDAYIRQQTQR